MSPRWYDVAAALLGIVFLSVAILYVYHVLQFAI